MIYINRPDLDKQSLYTTVLQTIEDISDEYALQKDFGTLSMANQEVVEFLMQTYDQLVWISAVSLTTMRYDFALNPLSPCSRNWRRVKMGFCCPFYPMI